MLGDGQNSHDMADLNLQFVTSSSFRIIIYIADLTHRVCPSNIAIIVVIVVWNILPNSYGLVWISTTLVFVIASLGNCATYLMQKRSVSNSPWSFDVSYINMAAGAVYGYALLVPMVFYFLLQYLGSNVSLVCFWCMWGYSLSVFIFSFVQNFFASLKALSRTEIKYGTYATSEQVKHCVLVLKTTYTGLLGIGYYDED